MIEIINQQQLLLPGYEIIPWVFDDECSGTKANHILLEKQLIYPDTFVFMTGLGCSTAAMAVASIAPIILLPTVSWAATATELSDRSVYPFFYRSVVSEAAQVEAAFQMAVQFLWKTMVIVKGPDARFGLLASIVAEYTATKGIAIADLQSVLKPDDAMLVVSKIILHRTRILYALSYEDSIQWVHCAAWHGNVTGLIILTLQHSNRFWLQPVKMEPLVCSSEVLAKEAQYMLMIGNLAFRKDVTNLTCAPGLSSADFEDWWTRFKDEHEGSDVLPLANLDAAHAADGVCMVVLALQAVLFNGTSAETLRRRDQATFLDINAALTSLDFEGVSGRITFPENGLGDPAGLVQLWQLQRETLVSVGVFDFFATDRDRTIEWDPVNILQWPGNSAIPSASFATCGQGHEPRGVQCQLCPQGKSKSHNESIPCSNCMAGRFASTAGRTTCAPCPNGFMAAAEGALECAKCPYWQTSDSEHMLCSFNNVRLVGEIATHILVLLSLTSFFTRFRRRIKILDLDLKDGRLIMTTMGGHKFLHGWRGSRSTPVLLRGTGRVELDDKWMRVRVLTSQTVELLSHREESIARPLATSRGYLSQPFWAECLDTEVFWCRAPMAVVALACLFGAIIIAETNDLDWAHFIGDLVAGAAVGIAHQCWRRTHRPKLQQRIRKFRRELLVLAPHPTSTPRGPGRAVALEKLQQFYNTFCDFIRHRDMHYVNSNLVLPLTHESKVAYADLIGSAEVRWFVSHSWNTVFRNFVDTLTKHAHSLESDDAAYWICTFSNNQWNLPDELGADILDSSFYLALQHRTCVGTAMVVTDSSPPLERIWCLFEAATTCERSNSDSEFRGLFLCTPNGVLNSGMGDMDLAIQLARSLIHIDLRDAKYSYREDRDKIMERVEAMEGGLNAINRYVRGGIRDALLQMHTSFEKDFNKVVFTLRASSAKLSSLLSDGDVSAELSSFGQGFSMSGEDVSVVCEGWPSGGDVAGLPPSPPAAARSVRSSTSKLVGRLTLSAAAAKAATARPSAPGSPPSATASPGSSVGCRSPLDVMALPDGARSYKAEV